ncbi:uncharacterized protein HMPREF1541_00669 [Cyphellophora europaea CBS 101466]|uniref:Arrestin-like N-terminal domain-containing protein n=1 Tax=Cyphellophora europaea (strain CBS 101466) TaxID=1220924 RepID=W2SF17_CYPE1|nr:uncharacterized protein HMPREF1541_00669 [Cyphellophora europaea CBS 101466]ETN46484.1 hypothetical protein HMPREF1541_00669 [Cyphellophora europaea CBS 101466]
MSIKIYVKGYDGTALPTGSLCEGHIEVHFKKAEHKDTIKQVLVNFYGRSKARITREERRSNGSNGTRTVYHHYDSKCLLFNHHYPLDNPTFSPPLSRRGEDGGILIFPYSFRIPTHAEPQDPYSTESRGAQVLNPSGPFPGTLGYDPPGYEQPPLPLPDSCDNFYTRIDSRFQAEASVRYTIHAICPQLKAGASRLWMGEVDEKADINIINPVSLPAQLIQWKRLAHEDAIRTLRLLPFHQTNRLSFRENVRSVFKKDRLPWCSFRMTMAAPDILWLDRPSDQPLPISLSIERIGSGEGSASSHRASSTSDAGPPSPLPAKAGASPPDNKNSLSPYPSHQSPSPSPALEFPTPPIYLKRLTLNLITTTLLRGSDPKPTSYGGQTYEAVGASPIWEWRADKANPMIELHANGIDTATAPFELGRELGITWAALHRAAAAKYFGGLQSEFVVPNLHRSFGIDWELRLECAGEEFRWESPAEFGGGFGLRALRGDGTPSDVDGGGRGPQVQALPPMQFQRGPLAGQLDSPPPPPPEYDHAGVGGQVPDALTGKMANLYVQDPGEGQHGGGGSSSSFGNAIGGGGGGDGGGGGGGGGGDGQYHGRASNDGNAYDNGYGQASGGSAWEKGKY